MRARALILGFAVVLVAWRAGAGPFRVGLSKVDLTPLPPGVSAVLMTGAPVQPNHFADGLDLGLTVRAAYIANADGTQPVVLVSADLINMCAADADFARDPSHYGDGNLTRERILISITHTHNAPAACDTSMRVQGTEPMRADASYDSTWRNHVRNKFREAIQLAYDRSKLPGAAASLKFARNKIDLGVNRRSGQSADLTDSNGTSENSPDGYDRTVDAVNIVGDDGLRKGMLFFYGMHPVALLNSPFPDPADASACRPANCSVPANGNHYFHPDYPGFARKWIESATPEDDIAIFFQAAGGNVNPAAGCWVYCVGRATGEDLGAKVLSMFAGAQNATGGNVAAGANTAYDRTWAAPLQTAAGDHRIGGSAGEMRGNQSPAPGPGASASGAWLLWADHYCSGTTGHGGGNDRCVAKSGLILDRSQDMEFQTLTIGNWRVAGLAHEPVTQWGLKLRQNWPGQWVTAVGYANREHNYLPTSAQLDVDDSCYAASPACGPGYTGYEGFVAQVLNGNPAPWATRATTATSTTGATYDLDAELAHVFKTQAPQRVNYADRWHGSTATASSEMDSASPTPRSTATGSVCTGAPIPPPGAGGTTIRSTRIRTGSRSTSGRRARSTRSTSSPRRTAWT